jgi:hypothetical protein
MAGRPDERLCGYLIGQGLGDSPVAAGQTSQPIGEIDTKTDAVSHRQQTSDPRLQYHPTIAK